MKSFFRIVLLLFLIAGLSPAQDGRQFLRSIDLLGQPMPTESAGISPGLSVSSKGAVFPYLNMNVPFGGRYYFHGALAAAQDPQYALPLFFMQLGVGTADLLKAEGPWFYNFGTAVRHYRSRYFENLSVAGTLMFGIEFGLFRLAAGLDMNVQHHQIRDAAVFPLSDERVYGLAPKIAFYSSYGNMIFTAGSGVFVAGLSWTLKTE
ncbi:MAG: hypothetical protein WC372_05755 [Candidatus Neomarinimicrobiota bacterium]|nr:hypothetical protein [Candidatus Neomarinimicrobiota bacterium]MDX9780868.1 hypothetical protein [bacterium]